MNRLPTAHRINLTGDISLTSRSATTGERFRDMAAVTPSLAKADKARVQQHIPNLGNRNPSIDKYLQPRVQGDKGELVRQYRSALAVCGSSVNGDSMYKYLTVLASPLRQCLIDWVKFGVGLERFQLHGIHEMVLSQAFVIWNEWLATEMKFLKYLAGQGIPLRYIDGDFVEALASSHPRDIRILTTLFYDSDGNRKQSFLHFLNNDQYQGVFARLSSPQALNFKVMGRKAFADFMRDGTSAVRVTMPQVVEWLVPGEFETPKTGRWTPKVDVKEVIQKKYYEPRGCDKPEKQATRLCYMAAELVWSNKHDFAVKYKPHFDTYPTVIMNDTSSGKKTTITETEYVRRFQTNQSWCLLAKAVADFTGGNLQAPCLALFNKNGH